MINSGVTAIKRTDVRHQPAPDDVNSWKVDVFRTQHQTQQSKATDMIVAVTVLDNTHTPFWTRSHDVNNSCSRCLVHVRVTSKCSRSSTRRLLVVCLAAEDVKRQVLHHAERLHSFATYSQSPRRHTSSALCLQLSTSFMLRTKHSNKNTRTGDTDLHRHKPLKFMIHR